MVEIFVKLDANKVFEEWVFNNEDILKGNIIIDGDFIHFYRYCLPRQAIEYLEFLRSKQAERGFTIYDAEFKFVQPWEHNYGWLRLKIRPREVSG